MMKSGLYRVDQLSDLRKARSLFGGARRISVTLYDRLAAIPNGEEWAERILFLHCDGRGTFKRTYRRRFDDFDDEVIRRIPQLLGDRAALWIHDAGVSDARTACDFFRKVTTIVPVAAYYASDYESALSILERRNIKVSMNSKGQVLEIVRPPFVFNMIKPENFRMYPVNYVFYAVARAFDLPHVLAAYQRGEIEPRKLLLCCREALQLAESDSRFELIEHDLLAPAPFDRPLDVVRVMNVLNNSYFTRRQLSQIVDRIFASLAEGGLLVVGSNDDPETEVRGAIYRRSAEGFVEQMRSGPVHDAHRAITEYGRR